MNPRRPQPPRPRSSAGASSPRPAALQADGSADLSSRDSRQPAASPLQPGLRSVPSPDSDSARRARLFGATHDAPAGTAGDSPDPHSENLTRKMTNRNWNVVWSGAHKTHQISLRLVAILAFAMLAVIIVFTPLRGYIKQQEQLRDLQSQLEASKSHVAELKQDIARWNDPQFLQAQARDRLGYVMPGQTLYTVDRTLLSDADPSLEQRVQEANDLRRSLTPFYITVWDAIAIAGQSGELSNPQNVPIVGTDKPASEPEQPTTPRTTDEAK